MQKPWGRWSAKGGRKKVNHIPLDKIVRSPFQPRREFDEREIEELASSIASYGVIQPIIVRRQGEMYQIIAGERRFRACHILGHTEIPAIIEEMDDERAAAISLIENLQRRELNYFEEASAYNILISVFGLTQEEVAKRVGKSQSAIANKLRLLKIPETVRSLISTGSISERHVRALLRLGSADLQMNILQQIYERDLTVKETEELIEKNLFNREEQESRIRQSGHSISMFIKDARIFLNTIKETVKRAKQTGVDIEMMENENETQYEVVIRIAKSPEKFKYLMQG